MRIRKNARVSPLLFTSHASAPEDLLPHVCKLNQSPWDVIPFAHHDSSHYQFQAEDSSFNGNGSYGDSIGAVESVASMMDIVEDKAAAAAAKPNTCCDIDHNDNIEKGIVTSKGLGDKDEARRSRDNNDNGIGFSKKVKISMFCQKNDGKGWHCKKEAKQGHSFCEHHLSLLRSYNNSNTSNHNNNAVSNNVASKKAPATAAASPTVGSRRVRAKAKKGGSSNPYEFYYYSGFGPLWARKRGGEKDKNQLAKSAENDTTTHETAPQSQSQSQSSSSQIFIDNEKFDYIDYEDEDDDDNGSGDSGRKRMRKPVKARSLKSLM